MGVAIVAIPSEQDPVWKYSSEKIPHMTLIYLGDIQDQGPELAEIESFIQHIVDTSLPRFGMSVDRRGTLGPDNADVLFFADHHDRSIKVARANMLQEPHIRAAYENADQLDGWTPHLTMGYPATPAKKDDRDYPGFSWVNFDRLALWIDNYDGPTFQLQDQYLDVGSPDGVLAMSDTLSEAYAGVYLEHHGVKGMKWGVHHEKRLQLLNRVADGTGSRADRAHVSLTQVSGDSIRKSGSLQTAAKNKAAELQGRKDRIQSGKGTFADRVALAGGDRLHENSGAKAARVAKKDAKFERPNATNFLGRSKSQAVLKDAIKNHKKEDLPRIRNKPEYSKKNLKKDPALKAKYDKEVASALDNQIRKSVEAQGKNASGTRKYKVTVGKDYFYMEGVDVKHAQTDIPADAIRINLTRDENGFITDFDIPDAIVKQSDTSSEYAGVTLASDILAHHGVKGMKWGVRKDTSTASPTPDTANTDRSGYTTRPVKRAKQEIIERTGTDVIARSTPGRGVRTVGGNQREASADAIRARTAQQIAKKSTLDALSNKELQDLVTRMNLEQQYNRLAFEEGDSRASTGEKFARKALNDYGDTAVTALASNPTTAAFAVPVGLAISGLKAADSAHTKKLANAPGAQSKKDKNKNN